MQNKIQEGDTLTFTASGALTGGDPKVVGDIFGVVESTVASGEIYALAVKGVFSLAKATDIVVVAGQNLFWDATASKVTTVGAGNRWIGAATEAAGASETTVKVRLSNGVPETTDSSAITVTAPVGDTLAGVGYVIENLFGVALTAEDAGDPVQVITTGQVTLAKKSADTIALGQKVYWDDTNKEVTETQGYGFYEIGKAAAVKAGSTTTVPVILNGVAVAPETLGYRTITAPAPTGGTTAGVMYLIENMLAVALETKAQTVACVFATAGTHTLAKKSTDTINLGQVVYFDPANSHITETAATMYQCGISTAIAGNGVTTLAVILDGKAVIQEGA